MTKRLFLIGSTGSIGRNALEVIEHINKQQPPQNPAYQVVGLAAKQNGSLLQKQIHRFSPEVVSIENEKEYERLIKIFPKVHFYRKMTDALEEIAFDLLLNAVVGSEGLQPTMMAFKKSADVALANKETLVSGGDLVMQAAKKAKSRLIPIDSEHAALMMLIRHVDKKDVSKLILTASGGPFWKKTPSNPTVQQVLAHPTWNMGSKISVDSATMMNKGFEIIEAHYLFEMPYDKIEVILHPESYVHSLVETKEGFLYAQMGYPDMRLPIQNALTFPHIEASFVEKFDLVKMEKMHFYPVDDKRFPLLKLAMECGAQGGLLPAVLNAANEACVRLFLEEKVSYEMIFSIIHRTIMNYPNRKKVTIEEIVMVDREVKQKILRDY